MSQSLGIVVLAAGHGTRMKSKTHKVLHPVAGIPMIDHVLRTAKSLSPNRLVVVLGHDADTVKDHVGAQAEFVTQDPPAGTGDAVRQAGRLLDGAVDTVLVLYGDTPLVRPETLRRLLDTHTTSGAKVTVLTAVNDDPGRVLRDFQGRVVGVVEASLATAEQLAISERNSGVCAFESAWLWPQLDALTVSPTGEYLLTDLITRAAGEAPSARAWPVATTGVSDQSEAMGVNNRVQLAAATSAMYRYVLERLMLDGVTILDPSATYVEPGVHVGADTVLLPGTHLQGATVVGVGCVIGPYSQVIDSTLAAGCHVRWSVIEGSKVGEGTDVGPYSHLRGGSDIASGVHLGNFVETKNTRIGSGSASGHFSYLGDAEIGRNVNIGAGTITVNYDGVRKHKTRIGDGAFIGSDTMLRAPVEVGDGAATGTGSVVTRDVPPGRLVVGMPARLVPKSASRKDRAAEGADSEEETIDG